MTLGCQEKEASRKHWFSNLSGLFFFLLNTVKEDGTIYIGYLRGNFSLRERPIIMLNYP